MNEDNEILYRIVSSYFFYLSIKNVSAQELKNFSLFLWTARPKNIKYKTVIISS